VKVSQSKYKLKNLNLIELRWSRSGTGWYYFEFKTFLLAGSGTPCIIYIMCTKNIEHIMMYTIYCNNTPYVVIIIFEMEGREVAYLPSAAPQPATLQRIAPKFTLLTRVIYNCNLQRFLPFTIVDAHYRLAIGNWP